VKQIPNQEEQEIVRSLRVLVGGNQGVTVKSNNNMIISDENGTIDINEIKLRVPAGTLHKRNQSLAQ
jgi:hypothetical protein